MTSCPGGGPSRNVRTVRSTTRPTLCHLPSCCGSVDVRIIMCPPDSTMCDDGGGGGGAGGGGGGGGGAGLPESGEPGSDEPPPPPVLPRGILDSHVLAASSSARNTRSASAPLLKRPCAIGTSR